MKVSISSYEGQHFLSWRSAFLVIHVSISRSEGKHFSLWRSAFPVVMVSISRYEDKHLSHLFRIGNLNLILQSLDQIGKRCGKLISLSQSWKKEVLMLKITHKTCTLLYIYRNLSFRSFSFLDKTKMTTVLENVSQIQKVFKVGRKTFLLFDLQ